MGIVIEPLRLSGSKSGIRKYSDDLITYLQVIKVYREDFKLLSDIKYVDNAGVYVLLGIDELGRTVVYTGESEDVYRRVVEEHSRDNNKDFFNEVFLITTTDNSLNKAEVLCLEDLIHNSFKLSPNVVIINSKATGSGNLNDRSLNKMKALTNVIVDILSSATNCNFLDLRYDGVDESVFTLRGIKGCGATATYKNGELIVHKDSIFSANVSNSSPKYVSNERESLMEQGSILTYKDTLISSVDLVFGNVNRATNIITGSQVPQPNFKWVNSSGITLEQYIKS